MIKREKYKQKDYGLSKQNEPGNDLILSGNVREYPDMFYAYKKFGEYFNLSPDSFFLANGCENAMKNVLLALKPKNMVWAIPTWRMPEVYSEALGFKLITKSFIYDEKENLFKLPDDFYDTKTDALYDNAGNTSCLTYIWNYTNLNKTQAKYNIIDLTYRNVEFIKYIVPILRENPKNIIIGSFDKMYGCGLRLGFAIFPKELEEKMALQREQYINMLAFNWIVKTNFEDNRSQYYNELFNLVFNNGFMNDNYITIKGKIDTTLPCYHFVVSRQEFTRFGIPNNESEFNAIKLILQDYLNGNNNK